MTDSNNGMNSGSIKDQAFDKKPLPDKIGNTLRQLYDEVLGEEVPDDFLNLLRKADSKGSQSAGTRATPKASE